MLQRAVCFAIWRIPDLIVPPYPAVCNRYCPPIVLGGFLTLALNEHPCEYWTKRLTKIGDGLVASEQPSGVD